MFSRFGVPSLWQALAGWHGSSNLRTIAEVEVYGLSWSTNMGKERWFIASIHGDFGEDVSLGLPP